MHLFGLTGGIASGKSVVAARLRARGVAVIDADQLARDAVAKGTPGLAEVVKAFGTGVLAADGAHDRGLHPDARASVIEAGRGDREDGPHRLFDVSQLHAARVRHAHRRRPRAHLESLTS